MNDNLQEIIDRIADLADRAARQGFMTNSVFLSPPQQAAAGIWLRKNKIDHYFNGGFEGAERQVCFLLPEYMYGREPGTEETGEVIRALRLRAKTGYGSLSHRDYMGSLLGLGIKRGQLGDILAGDNEAVVFVLGPIIDFIENNLTKVGSSSITIERLKPGEIKPLERNTEQIRITAASLRLDKIAAGGFGISRTQMAEYIRGGAVAVDWLEETRPDRTIVPGTTISLRGHGKIEVTAIEGLSRKSRHILLISRLI